MDAWLGITIAGSIVGGVIALPVIAHRRPDIRLARSFRSVGQWGKI